MIPHGGEGAACDRHGRGGFSLNVGVLAAEQAGRPKQAGRDRDHGANCIQTVSAGEERQRRIVIPRLRRDRLVGVQRNVRRIGDHQVHAAIEVDQRRGHIGDM